MFNLHLLSTNLVSSASPSFLPSLHKCLDPQNSPSHCNPSTWLQPSLTSILFFPCSLIQDGQSILSLPISGCLTFSLCVYFSLPFQLWRLWNLPSWIPCPCRCTLTKSMCFWQMFIGSCCSSDLGSKWGILRISKSIRFNIFFLSNLQWLQKHFSTYIFLQEFMPTDLFCRSPNLSALQG